MLATTARAVHIRLVSDRSASTLAQGESDFHEVAEWQARLDANENLIEQL